MRTTLTLDPDVQRLVEDEMHRRRVGMKTVVNEALRASLGPGKPSRPYRVDVHHTTLAPGVDPVRLNQLADELADEESLAKTMRARPEER